MYSHKCSLPNPVTEGHTETLWLTFIPQMFAAYPISTYIFNCHMLPKLLAAYIQYNYIILYMSTSACGTPLNCIVPKSHTVV